MLNRRRLFQITALILILVLALTACERPIPGTGGNDTLTEVTPDANSGGGEPADTSAEPPAATAAEPTVAADSDTPRVDEEPTATPEPAAEETTSESETEAAAEETAADTAAETTEETAAETTTETAVATPATHTVQAGENLYRIGLKYGISWVQLVEYNGLANANMIKVGQVLKLSANGSSNGTVVDPTVTPSPMTESTYTVKAGDNLFRIGLAYGISWIQIAEANGIVNPNQIKVGDVLKIPVSTPGPSPDFTHTVKAGETLFQISLRYGVPWTAIAEKNNIQSPYVIYVGQTLAIPGS